MNLTETNSRLVRDLVQSLSVAMPASLKSPSFGNDEARAYDADVMTEALILAGAAITKFLSGWVGEVDAHIGALANRPYLAKDFGKDAFENFHSVAGEFENFARSTETLQIEAAE